MDFFYYVTLNFKTSEGDDMKVKNSIFLLRSIQVVLLFIFFNSQLFAQSITNYTFAASGGTFTALSGATSPAFSGGVDDGYSNGIPIGFDFWYMGTRYTTISASTNGWLTLGADITNATPANLISTGGAPRPVLAPLWDDLSISSSSNFSYKTTGSAGSQVFTAEYLNVLWNYNAASARIYFQVKLYESTGKIEFIYERVGAPNPTSPSASIGITASGTGSGNYLSLDGPGASPTASSTTATDNIDAKPANGQTYTFTPPTPTAAPTNLTFSSITSNSMTLNWTDNLSNERGFVIYKSSDGITYSFAGQTAANATSSVQSALASSTTYYWQVYAVTEGWLSTALSGNQVTEVGPASTGPGGVGTMDGTSELELWLDANQGTSTTTDGANITQWDDQSGNSIHVTQGTAANQPTFENDVSNAINGFPVIRFAGTDELQFSNSSLNIANGFTVFLVKNDNTTQPGLNSGYLSIIGTDLGFRVYRGDGTKDKFIAKASGAWTSDYISTTGVTDNVPYIGEYKRSGTTMYLSRFGAAYITDAGTAGPLSFGTSPVVSVGSQASAEYLNGNIAETIVFSRAVNTAEKIIIENYLAAKYDVTLSGNDVYTQDNVGNGNYDYDVAGIARVDVSNIHNDAQGRGIVRVNNPSGLGDGEYFLWGHNGGTFAAANTSDVPSPVTHRLVRTWRVSHTGNVGTVDISFDLTGLGSVTESDLRLLVDTDNDGVFSDETPGGGGVISGPTAAGSNVYKFGGITIGDAQRFTLGTINALQTPLPIELIDFNASTVNDTYVQLDWQTASEQNNSYFTVERSKNGKDWQKVISVNGAGNSSVLLSYDAQDNKPYSGISYYRLKQTDFNGTYSYSFVRRITINQLEEDKINVFPNPASGSFNISLSGQSGKETMVVVRDLLGREHYSKVILVSGDTEIVAIDPANILPAGIYWVVATTQGSIFEKKIIIK